VKRIHPNFITILRALIFGPVALVCLMHGQLWWALLSQVLGELTDYLDGKHARRTNQISNLGKIFDPMCDSIFHMTLWMGFLAKGWVSVYPVMLFFARDAIVSTMRTYMASHQIVLAARWSGKIKMATQCVAQLTVVSLHLTSFPINVLECTELIVVWFAVIVAVVSLCDYLLYFFREVKDGRVKIN
jgi:CDP-diacylglycerol--glycerol-3-phosphate 3-phosphatidyltransferase